MLGRDGRQVYVKEEQRRSDGIKFADADLGQEALPRQLRLAPPDHILIKRLKRIPLVTNNPCSDEHNMGRYVKLEMPFICP
jgi:hypothetical protein